MLCALEVGVSLRLSSLSLSVLFTSLVVNVSVFTAINPHYTLQLLAERSSLGLPSLPHTLVWTAVYLPGDRVLVG